MDHRTPQCNHNQKGMCIHCLVRRQKKNQQQKASKLQQKNSYGPNPSKCVHPPHMKCLRCLPTESKKSQCTHPDYEQCKNCEHYIKYETFQQYLQQLANQCKHKKPCSRCVPPLARRTYSIDKTCRNHAPYPQAQCDACMAPTITIGKQTYSHVQNVKIMTNSIYKVSQTNCIGVLLGTQTSEGVIEVYDVYFPEDQDQKTGYLSPQALSKYKEIFSFFGLQSVGIIYSSPHLTSLDLMISSVFQEAFATFKDGNQLSKFVTMRLQFSNDQTNFEPHFECFMVSDQFQAFHRNGLLFQKHVNDANSFDLITTKHEEKMSQHPTFLRQGVQTDVIYFRQIITWIPTVFQQTLQYDLNNEYAYPFFTIEKQTLDHMKILLNLDPRDPLEKYRNIQFLLHLGNLIGSKDLMIFLYEFYMDNPDIFLKEKIKLCQKIEKNKDREMGRYPDNSYNQNYDNSYF